VPVSVRLSEPIGVPMTLPSGFSPAARTGSAPLEVCLRRGSITESVHRVHAVVCDGRGRVLMSAGTPGLESFIRSALKPFQALPFLSSEPLTSWMLMNGASPSAARPMRAPMPTPGKLSGCSGKRSWTALHFNALCRMGLIVLFSTIVPESTLPSSPLAERWAGRSRPISSRTTLSRSK